MLINLADVIVKTIPAKYSFLIFNYPVNQQKVYNDGMVYTFESEINTWSGVIATDELIASNYVYAIASAIEEFHTGQPVGSSFPRQIYLDMAKGGLTGTTFFNKNYPNDPNHKNYNDRIRIFARINTEKLGSQYGINTPLGTPCKK